MIRISSNNFNSLAVGVVGLLQLSVSDYLGIFASAQDTSFFSYDPNAENGPLNWGNLDIPGNSCNGEKQSGIDIITHDICTVIDGFDMNLGNCRLDDFTFVIDPQAAQGFLNTSNCNEPSFEFDDDSNRNAYNMFSLEMKAGSEHSINGQSAQAEIHFTHSSTEDPSRYGVIVLLVNATATEQKQQQQANGIFSIALSQLLNSNPTCAISSTSKYSTAESRQIDTTDNTQQRVQPYRLIPEGSAFYRYEGSFTTPPCLEIVTYVVAEEILYVSQEQMDILLNLIINWKDPTNNCFPGSIAYQGSTSRTPVQPLNGRTVTRYCPGTSNDEFTNNNNGNDNEDEEQSNDGVNSDSANNGSSSTSVISNMLNNCILQILVTSYALFFSFGGGF